MCLNSIDITEHLVLFMLKEVAKFSNAIYQVRNAPINGDMLWYLLVALLRVCNVAKNATVHNCALQI